MILLVRVDHRLLHGQVAVSWAQGLKANCILCCGDRIASDSVWRTTLKLGKPSGCKLVIKNMADSIEALNSGVTDKYRLLISVQTIAEAKQLADAVGAITSINLGNTLAGEGKKQISRQIFVTPEEEEMLRELLDRGVEVEIRALADDPKVDVVSVL